MALNNSPRRARSSQIWRHSSAVRPLRWASPVGVKILPRRHLEPVGRRLLVVVEQRDHVAVGGRRSRTGDGPSRMCGSRWPACARSGLISVPSSRVKPLAASARARCADAVELLHRQRGAAAFASKVVVIGRDPLGTVWREPRGPRCFLLRTLSRCLQVRRLPGRR